MTDPTPQTTPTRDEAVPAGWRYSINYGPDGEENFANVYAADGQFVGNLRTHHAIAICNAFAVCEKLASAPAPASGGVDAGRVTLFSALEAAYIRGAAWCAEMGMTHTFSELRKAAYDYADKEEKDVICREVRASISPAATPVSEAGGDWRSVLAGMVEAMNRYGHEVGDGDIPSAHRNLISQAEQLLAETTSSVAEDVRALAIVRMFKERIERHGNWDEGCFYYGNTSASELQEPLRLATAALAKPASSPAGGDVAEREVAAQAALARIKKLRDQSANQAKFADVDEARLFRQFVERLDRAVLSQSTSAGRVGE